MCSCLSVIVCSLVGVVRSLFIVGRGLLFVGSCCLLLFVVVRCLMCVVMCGCVLPLFVGVVVCC